MEDSTAHSEFPELSLSAYTRLQRLHASPSDSSALILRKELMHSLSPIPIRSFVPFVHERDRLGKLITGTKQVKSQPDTPPLREEVKHAEASYLPRRGKPMKVSGRQKQQVPPVGTYSPGALQWGGKSFSMPKIVCVKKEPQLEREKVRRIRRVLSPPLVSRFQYTVKRDKRSSPHAKVKDKFDILRPEALFEMSKRTNFQSVRLDDSPDGLARDLQLAERRQLKEEKLHLLKEVMAQFRKGKFF